MTSQLQAFFSAALHAFVAWAVVLFVLHLSLPLPRPVFIGIHYVLNIVVFGFVFKYFFETHPNIRPFTVVIYSMSALFIYEAIFFTFFVSAPSPFLNYVDWIFPAFLIISTIYFVGKQTK